MIATKTKSNLDKPYFYNAHEFIPVACHFNEKTLITKNGELLQIIKIDGLYSENISEKITNLRYILQQSFANNINDEDFACWIHTIRETQNLSDEYQTDKIFSNNLNRVWKYKNLWEEKYSNKIYISILIKGLAFDIKEIYELFDSFNLKSLKKIHDKHLHEKYEKLNQAVLNIYSDIKDFNSSILHLISKDDGLYSENLEIYNKFLNFVDESLKIDARDLSKTLGTVRYAVGNNVIELEKDSKKKYITVFSTKEFENISDKALDYILQTDLDFITTEIFYYEDIKNIKSQIDEWSKLYKDSRNEYMLSAKGFSNFYDIEQKYRIPYCKKQISISLFSDDLNSLEIYAEIFSKKLAKIGLVHVREDINIENSFWAQMPGNFEFIRRAEISLVEHVASFATIQNTNPGSKNSKSEKLGRYLTIFETNKNTVYYYDFYNQSKKAFNLIVGEENSGKTIFMNFLNSESMKYDSNILYLTNDSRSKVFLKSLGGKLYDSLPPINPFSINLVREDKNILREIIKLLFSKNKNSSNELENFTNEENIIIEKLCNFVLTKEDFTLYDFKDFEASDQIESEFLKRIEPFLDRNIYGKYFNHENNKWRFDKKTIVGFNFSNYSDSKFKNDNYPTEKVFIPSFYKDFFNNAKFRDLSIISLLIKYLNDCSDEITVVNIDNFNLLTSNSLSHDLYEMVFQKLIDKQIITQLSVKFLNKDNFFKSDKWSMLQKIKSSSIYLPFDILNNNSAEIFGLDKNERDKLMSLKKASRMFMLKKDNLHLVLKVGLGKYIALVKFLSSDEDVIKDCEKFIEKLGNNPDEWVVELYNYILDQNS